MLEVYYILIGGLLDVSFLELVWNFFEDMKKFGCVLDVFIYNLLFNVFGKFGKIDEFFDFYEEM